MSLGFAVSREHAMVIGYHLVWTAYGLWLPNDPRGSSSHEIRCDEIVGLGELHRGRKTVQADLEIRDAL